MEFNQIKEKLILFLENDKNVPSEAIKGDLIFSKQTDNGTPFYFPHLVVLDNQNNQPLSIFIIDDGLNRNFEIFINSHIQNINTFIKVPIIIYFITYKNDNLHFSEVLDDGSLTKIESDNFPDYKTMKNNLFVLQGMALNQIDANNHKLKQKLEQKRKNETVLARFLSLLILVISTTSIILYYTNSYNDHRPVTTNTMAGDLGTIGKELDSVFNELLTMKQQADNKNAKKDTIFINTTTTYAKLDKRLTIIEKGISENPEKTLSNINIEHKINLLQSQIDGLKEASSLRYNSLNNNISLISNLTISLYVGLIFCILGWLLAVTWKKKKD